MPRFYLRRSDNTWSDAGDYDEIPTAREEGTWEEGVPPSDSCPYLHQTLNEKLVEVFLNLIPQHTGEPYFTADVISRIWQTKLAVTDANTQDPSGTFGKAILSVLALPQEMEDDKQSLLDMFP